MHSHSSFLHQDLITVWLTSPVPGPSLPSKVFTNSCLSLICFQQSCLMTCRNWTRMVSLPLPRVIQGFAVPLKSPFKAGPWYFHPVLPNSPSLSEPHSACNLLGSSPSAFQTLLFPRLCTFSHYTLVLIIEIVDRPFFFQKLLSTPPQTIFRSSDVDLFLTVFFLHWFYQSS